MARTRGTVRTRPSFAEDCHRAGLSDAAYRTHLDGLHFSSKHMLDGVIPKRSLRTFAGSEEYQRAADELVACGFWCDRGEDYQIVHHLDEQESRRQVSARRAYARKRARSRRSPAYARLRSEILTGLHTCSECGAVEDLTVDHVEPLNRDGSDDEANLQVLCGSCNSRKGG